MNILILLGVLAIFVVLLNFASKYTFVTGKRMYWILGVYIVILLFSTVFFYTVLEKRTSGVKQDDLDQIPNLENVVNGEDSFETITPYIVDQQSYFYDHDQLLIQVDSSDSMNVPILISRESEEHNEIEATVYQAPTILEGLDITESMPLVELRLADGDGLIAHMPWAHDLDLDVYKASFPFRQFTGERLFQDSDRFYSQVSQLIHLNVPKDIDLDIDEDVWYHYLTTD